MQIHRSRHERGFTVLANTQLQDRRLSYTARGLLADLLSRPDGWSEDGRRMADTSPQGRHAVAKALRELAAFGYYRVDRVRRGDGTVVSVAHVYDTPQGRPDLTRPGSGGVGAEDTGANPVKDREKEPTLPRQRSRPIADRPAETRPGGGEDGRAEPPPPTAPPPQEPPSEAPPPAVPPPTAPPPTEPAWDGPVGEAVSTLFRVLRPEPRLRLGTVEALALAPLVGTWLERGYGARELSEALLGGLPSRVHSAPGILRNRLTRKLPPAPEPVAPAKPPWSECLTCARPIPQAGICRTCAGLVEDDPGDAAARANVAVRGRARVRAALQADSGRLAGAMGRPSGVGLGPA